MICEQIAFKKYWELTIKKTLRQGEFITNVFLIQPQNLLVVQM